jgi:hypothetical protein
MPLKIGMNLESGNYSAAFIAQYKQSMAIANAKKPPSALNTAMIGRIHNVRPGCCSCGK